MKIEKLAIIIIVLSAVAFCFFGVKWLINPMGMSGPLGIVLSNADAITDAQAVYGGLELGIGMFLLYCAYRQQFRFAGLLAATLTLTGLGFSRLFGIITVLGPITRATTQLLTTDLIGIFVNAIVCTLYARSSSGTSWFFLIDFAFWIVKI